MRGAGVVGAGRAAWLARTGCCAGGLLHAATSATRPTTARMALFDELEVARALGARSLGRLRSGQRRGGLATAGEHVLGDVLRPHGAALLAFDHRGVDRGPGQHAVERLAAERERAADRGVVD